MTIVLLTAVIGSLTYYLGFINGVKKATYKAYRFAKERSDMKSYKRGFEDGLEASKLINKIRVAISESE